MLVENSIVIADFIRGLFVPLGVLTFVCAIAGFIIFMVSVFTLIEEHRKSPLRWWLIPIGLELVFALWFFSTFSLQPIS